MAKTYTNEQAADMLRTTVDEVLELAEELEVDDDDWDLQSIAEADELLEDNPETAEQTPRPRAAANVGKALDRTRKLIALAVDESTTIAERRNAAIKACELIDKHELLDQVAEGEGNGEVAEAIGDAVEEITGSVVDALKRTVGPGLKRAINKRPRRG